MADVVLKYFSSYVLLLSAGFGMQIEARRNLKFVANGAKNIQP